MILDKRTIAIAVEDYLSQRGLSIHKPFRCLSPEHEDKHPSMSYDSRRGNVHCFSCGVTYDIFDLLGIEYNLVDFKSKWKKAADLYNLTPPVLEKRMLSDSIEQQDYSADLVDLRKKEEHGNGYFSARGITALSKETYGLFVASGRAYFPCWEQGKCVGWSARAVEEDVAPRYLNSRGAIGLWGSDALYENGRDKPLFIVEGAADAICLEQMGHRAIALCGSQNTGKLLCMLEKKKECATGWRYVLCGDPDAAGQSMNRTLQIELMKKSFFVEILELRAEDGDVGDLYQRDPERLKALIEQIQWNQDGIVPGIQIIPYGSHLELGTESAAELMEEFFKERQRRAGLKGLSTGISGLDKLLNGGLYPGLYVLGAISSLGKTSFALQIADYIAEHGGDVLYISLEQSRYELMAKSVSRTTAAMDLKCALTARQVMNGMPGESITQENLVRQAAEVYARAGRGMYIREGITDIGTGDIALMVEQHKARRGNAPVVVVDYLQILSFEDCRATDKQNIDRAVVALKRLSRDFDIPVLAISSFNRENYKVAVSMEAFKESGAVEYSADVLIGLQLIGVGCKEFDVNAAKLAEPRQVELVVLKNRNGIPYGKIPLLYYAQYNLFAPGQISVVRSISQTALQTRFGLAKV